LNLDDALDQIAAIRSQMAASAVFRGYRCTSTLFSALIAVATAVVQQLWIPDAANHVEAYLELWFSAGGLCFLIVAVGVFLRYRRSDSPLDRALCFTAARQFLPCLIAGGLITYVLADSAWQSMWIVPGLWSILFGMGILASRPLLPTGTTLVGAFYLLCGLASIEWSHHVQAFSPWVMAIPFGAGQSLAAGILYWNLERHDAVEHRCGEDSDA
jgi:hypothetical protein